MFWIICGWALSLWGIFVFVGRLIRKDDVHWMNFVWAVLGILFLIWRLVPGFKF